jgi:hypothetical protein
MTGWSPTFAGSISRILHFPNIPAMPFFVRELSDATRLINTIAIYHVTLVASDRTCYEFRTGEFLLDKA